MEKNGDRTPEVDLVVEDLPLCAGLGRAQVVGEHLDSVLAELRELCGMQRQIVLDEAAQGHDCQIEAQELNRLVELEEDVARELAFRGEPLPEPDAGGSQLEPEKLYRICSLQSDVGGGCEAQVEGEAGAPLQTKIISIEEVLKDIEEWWNPMLAGTSQSTLRRRVGRCFSPLLPRSNGVPAVVGRRSRYKNCFFERGT